MRQILAMTLAVLLSAGAAVGQDISAGFDWAGAYGGVTLNRFSGEASDGVTYDYEPNAAPGAFVGYNLQRGRLVFGGELSYSNTAMMIVDAGGNDFLNPVLDLRGRVGYSVGRAVVYGFAGYSRAEMTVNGDVNDATMTGTIYGLGVDFAVSKQAFVGLNYSIRNMNGTGTTEAYNIQTDVKNMGLRIGLNF